MTTLSESGHKRREAKQEKKRKQSARMHLSEPRRRIKPADRAYDVFAGEKEIEA